MITCVVMLATLLQTVDATIANVALPHIQGTMGVYFEQSTWVITSYVISATIFLPLTSYLSVLIGLRNLYMVSVAGFVAFSLLCAVAQNLTLLVVFRSLQGAFSAPLLPLSQVVLLNIYRESEQAKAMSIWGMGVMIGPVAGPVIGGILTENYGWQWVFLINVPLGAIALVGLYIYLGRPPKEKESSRIDFDFLGFMMLSVSLVTMQFMLDRGPVYNWLESDIMKMLLLISTISISLFLWHLTRANIPYVNPFLFRDRNFVAGLTMIFVVGIHMLAALTLLPAFMRTVLNYEVIDIGIALVPRGIGTMLSMLLVGRLMATVEPRMLVVAGFSLVSISLIQMMNFDLNTSLAAIGISGFLQGAGLGCMFVPLTTITFATIPAELRIQATPLFSLFRSLGNSFGVALVAILLARNTTINSMHIYGLSDFLRWQLLEDLGLLTSNSLDSTLHYYLLAQEQATLLAFLQDFRFLLWLSLLTIPMVFLVKIKTQSE